jgi:hypothetical protein
MAYHWWTTGSLFHDGARIRCAGEAVSAEEVIWSKAFVTERERYDGADIMHVLLACAETLD